MEAKIIRLVEEPDTGSEKRKVIKSREGADSQGRNCFGRVELERAITHPWEMPICSRHSVRSWGEGETNDVEVICQWMLLKILALDKDSSVVREER